MKALFAHDNKFHKYKNTYYSTGLSSTVFQRYLKIFDSLIICGREIIHEESAIHQGSVASFEPYVQFSNIPNKSALKILFNTNDRTHIASIVREVDFVIARLDSIIGFIAINYARKFGIPYVIELCTDPWDCYINYGWKGKVLAPIITAKTKKEVNRAENVIYVTNKYLQERYPNFNNNIAISNVECIPVDNIDVRILNYQNFSTSNRIILGTAGALLPFKGQRYVIKAMDLLRQKGINNVLYRLAGEGSDKKNLLKLAKDLNLEDKVEFCGALSSNQMNDFYDSIDIYVQPSLQEGLPRTVIEAMSRGLFCIGARTAGIPELISESCIFEKKSSLQIANLINNLTSTHLVEESISNYHESEKYKNNVLDNRRTSFFAEIITSCR